MSLAPAGFGSKNISWAVVLLWLKPQQLLERLWLPLRACLTVLRIAKQGGCLSRREKIETLIYLFVLQLAPAASLLCSPGTPSHTLELKIHSFYLGRGSNGFLIWRKYRNNGWTRSQKTGGEAHPRPVLGELQKGPRILPMGQAQRGLRDEPLTGPAPWAWLPPSLDLGLPCGSSLGLHQHP